MVVYILQSKYKRDPWTDIFDDPPFRSLPEARKFLDHQLLADTEANWTDGGKRKWRIVRRTIADHVIWEV